MTDMIPKIDNRSQQDLVSEIRRLILYYCPEFESIDDIAADRELDALVNIFSNMMGHVNYSLNQALDKNFIAFLNLIGVSPTSPIPSKAPLVFKLNDDWEKDGFIPSGAKISAQPENKDEVVFETQSDLTVIRPSLVRAVSIDPAEDRWSNLDYLVTEDNNGDEAELFRGESPIIHRLYIGHSKLFSIEDAKVNLRLRLNGDSTDKYSLQWYYFDEKGDPQPLKLENGSRQTLLQTGGISFSGIKGISQKEISGYKKDYSFSSWKNHWIYAELKSALSDTNLLPYVEDIKISIDTFGNGLSPEIAVFNYAPVDLTKDFYPFGERPIFNDTFYFACKEAFSKKAADITLSVNLSDAKSIPDTKNILLAWECWNGFKWTEFAKTGLTDKSGSSTCIKEGLIYSDTTYALTKSGSITFKAPEIQAHSINGEENYWIRVRIIGGNYGEDGKVAYVPKPVIVNNEEIIITEAQYIEPTFIPPSVKEILIDYTYSSPEVFPENVITENNFVMGEKTKECLAAGKIFKLFSSCTDSEPALYLGFDRDISNLPVSLFFPLKGDQKGKKPVVAWEYSNGRKWLTLSVNDAVRDFTRREIQQLVIPGDIEKTPLFGSEMFWVRARLESAKEVDGGYTVYPRLNAIYSNAVWASNSNTIQNEILGSSNGEPNQIFQFTRTPVLNGQVVRVTETVGQGAPIVWEEVQTFSLSGPDSRHYMLDNNSGVITFGNGNNGMIPPAGKENIQCDYKYGGGSSGNVEAYTIKKLWDSYPGIDSVTNPVAADGGFDQEEVEETKKRGPHTLKSMDRGITCEDVEWLVREAAPQIAIVKCFPTMDQNLDFCPGKATVIVVPDYDSPKPVPSQELLNDIEKHLAQRIPTVLNNDDSPLLDIIGPDYIRIGIEASVKYTKPESAKIIEGHIIENLREFLNPLKGGQEKTGWSLGKNLYISEVCSVIKNTSGVDYITDISVKASVQCYTLNIQLIKDRPFRPAISYPSYCAVKTKDNRIIFALAQKLEANKDVRTLLVKGFREGDKIELTCVNCPQKELIVETVEGDTLQCRTFDGEPLEVDYPVGSDIEAKVTPDLTIRSFILNEVKAQSESFYIKIAVPEARDIVFLSRNDEYINTTPLKISEVLEGDVFLEEDELVYSGEHFINKKSEIKFPYLLNRDTNIIHDPINPAEECLVGELLKEDRRYLEKISDEPKGEKCDYCFPKAD